MDLSDKHLETLRKCLDGDHHSCDKLVTDLQVSNKIKFIVIRYANEANRFGDWEDVAQKVKIKVLNYLKNKKFSLRESGISGFNSWLGRIARNTSIDYFFKRKDRLNESLDQHILGNEDLMLLDKFSEDNSDPSELLLYQELKNSQKALAKKIKEAIKQIDSQHPTRQFLKIWEEVIDKERKHKIVAQELKISQSKVSKTIKNLKKRVKKILTLEQEELVARACEELGYIPPELEKPDESSSRERSKEDWD